MEQKTITEITLDNVAQLEAAFNAGCALDYDFVVALSRALDEWAKQKKWAAQSCSNHQSAWEQEIAFGPKSWLADNKKTQKASKRQSAIKFNPRFSVGFDPDVWDRESVDGGQVLWIQRFCGLGASAGVRWYCPKEFVGLQWAQWKSHTRSQATEILKKTGFRYEVNTASFFLVVTVKLEDLKTAVSQGSLESCLQPWIDAFEACFDASSEFDKLTSSARSTGKKVKPVATD